MRTWFITAVFAVLALSGCLSDGDDTDNNGGSGSNTEYETYGVNKPSLNPHPAYGYPTPYNYSGLTVPVPDAWTFPNGTGLEPGSTGFDLVATTGNVSAGAGIFVFGHYVLASGNGPGHIIDIADPENPVKVAAFEQGIRDADLIMHPDGRLTAVMASSGFIHNWDITDPTNPIQLPDLEAGSHNAAVVPGTPIVYNANSAGGATNGLVGPEATLGNGVGITEIFDVTDPNNPVRLPDFENGYGCHDITFHITEDRQRAYCAGIEMTQIWDISDPINPEVLVNIPVHHGVAGTPSASVPVTLFSHLAMVNHEGDILIVGDETGGGLANACDVDVTLPGQTVAGPTGNLWFYDVSDELNPVLLSWMNPNNPILNPTQYDLTSVPPAGCTAHFGRIVGDEELMLMSFYGAGIVLVDFSNPSNPIVLDQYMDGTNTWDAWEWQGYVYTGDLAKGVQVFKLN